MQDLGTAVVQALVHAGVKRCYTVPCDLVWLLKAIEAEPRLQLISVRHESSAAFMAEADAKLTGVPGVVITGRSVGATNASNGVETAREGSVPMLILMNDVETASVNREAFQKTDLMAFYRPITKRCFVVGLEDSLPDVITHALRASMRGRAGPVMVTIPSDMAGEVQDWVPPPDGGRRALPAASQAAIAEAAQLLAHASRPVIIAGGGARLAREELIALAEKYQAGVYVTFRRQDIFPNDHPLYLGHLAMATPPDTVPAARDADVVLVVGSKLSQMTTQRYTVPHASAKVIQVDLDAARIGAYIPATVALHADARTALRMLVDQPVQVPPRDWAAARQAYVASTTVPADRSKTGVDPSQVIAAMIRALPEDAILTSEAGGYATFLHHHWVFRHPNTQAAPANGTMGYSVPAAIAAKLAMPERCAVALVGDGGYLMNGGNEVETAVRHGAPVIIVVFNNRVLSGGGYLDTRKYNKLSDVDFAMHARALGGDGATVREVGELPEAFRRALASQLPFVIDVKTDAAIISPNGRPLMMAGPLAPKVDRQESITPP